MARTLFRIILESPFAGDLPRNKEYLNRVLKDSIVYRSEASFASHALYPQVLDDTIATERTKGINAGFAWMEVADAVAFYSDYGYSPGMRKAKARAKRLGKFIVERKIGKNP